MDVKLSLLLHNVVITKTKEGPEEYISTFSFISKLLLRGIHV